MTHIRTLLDQMAEIDEGRMKDIFTMDQEGQSVKEIAKRLKLPLGTVKKILGEEVELQEFSRSQLDTLAKQYSDLRFKLMINKRLSCAVGYRYSTDWQIPLESEALLFYPYI